MATALSALCEQWNPEELTGAAAFQVARLALEARNAEILVTCVQAGFDWWHPQVDYRQSGQFAIDAMELFESDEVEPPIWFVIRAAEMAQRMGSPQKSSQWFKRVRDRYPNADDAPFSRKDWAAVIRHDALLKPGAEGISDLERALKVYEQLGEVQGRAVTLGDIARMYTAQGRVEDALKLHQEN